MEVTGTQVVEWGEKGGIEREGTRPMQCFIAKVRHRKDNSVAYEYISGFGQTLNHIKHKRVTLSAGTYIVMLEMEFDAALE